MTKTPDLIGSAEAARILNIDRGTLSRWVADGRLKAAIQLDGPTGARLFHRRDVTALAAEQEAAS